MVKKSYDVPCPTLFVLLDGREQIISKRVPESFNKSYSVL